MKLLARSATVILLGSFIVGAAVACGGGDTKKEPTPTKASASESTTVADKTPSSGKPTRISTRSASTTKTPAASGTPRAGATAKVTGTAKAAGTSTASGARGGALDKLDAFHYVVGITFELSDSQGGVNGKIEGDYVKPVSHSFTQTFDVGGIGGEESTIIIGDDAWLKKTSGDWTKTTADDPDVTSSLQLSSADPTFFTDDKFIEDIKIFDAEKDMIDGRSARRYTFDKEQFARLGDTFGSDIIGGSGLTGLTDFTFTVWVDEETETMAKAELHASGPAEELLKDSPLSFKAGDTASISLTVDVTRVNDKSIKIEPPV